MQAIHSLTTGVDATLEEATRLALDQTANFTLFDALQFLGSREVQPFDHHEQYRLLGQGSVRSAIEGTGGAVESSAYLLVHARASKGRVITGITGFIREITRQGEYFPLSTTQFIDLVEQTEEERTRGFENHRNYGELHAWRLGDVRIPALRESHGDWARMELASGAPYTALSSEDRRTVAPMVIGAVFAQFGKATADGHLLINPETHGGNILYDAAAAQAWLVDCGLLGLAEAGDLLSLIQVHSGFARRGLAGATATLLRRNGVPTLAALSDTNRTALLSGLEVFNRQLRAGTAPELLLPGLAAVVARSAGAEVGSGLDILFRGLQHLAPYLRDAGGVGQLPDFLSMTSVDDSEGLAEEIEEARKGTVGVGREIAQHSFPAGTAVGRQMRNGSVLTMGVLKEKLDPESPATSGPAKGMLVCVVEGNRQYVRPADLRIQLEEEGKTRWASLEELRGGPS
jgi:hypothetical protein